MIRWKIDKRALASARIRAAAAEALNDAAEHLLNEANQTVPIEEHILEASGDVSPATSSDLKASVFYGGEASAYAVKQHEDTTLRHDTGRRAKWLEMTFKENSSRVLAWLADTMRSQLP